VVKILSKSDKWLQRYYIIFVATTMNNKNLLRLNPTVVTQLALLTANDVRVGATRLLTEF